MIAPSTSQEILSIFKKHGHISYGERCTVLAHSVQAGCLAKEKGLGVGRIFLNF